MGSDLGDAAGSLAQFPAGGVDPHLLEVAAAQVSQQAAVAYDRSV